MNILSIIPARSGSKGLPGKNVKPIYGKPLIAYTIEASLKCRHILRTIVTTDSLEIAEVANKYGAETPFLRPEELSGDKTPAIDVVLHCLDFLNDKEHYSPDFVCLLQCTSPLRKEEHISEAIELVTQTKAQSVVSVCRADKSPYWAKIINDAGFLEDLISCEKEITRRQDLPEVYNLNGAIYINKTELIYSSRRLVSGDSRPYVMDKLCSFDIDDEVDFEICEYLIGKFNLEASNESKSV